MRTYAVRHPTGLSIAERAFDWDQLAYASNGVISVHTNEGTWVVPPDRAVWVPAGVAHRVDVHGPASIRTLYFAKRLTRHLPRSCRALNVSPLLRELILHTIRLGLLRLGDRMHGHVLALLLDQLHPVSIKPLQLPMPRDRRALMVARLLRDEPGSCSVAAAVKRVHAGRRTLERLFVAETGLTLGRWHQRAQLVEALKLLAAGEAVTRVALDVGYESPSAFVAMFRQQLGTTPGRYFASSA